MAEVYTNDATVVLHDLADTVIPRDEEILWNDNDPELEPEEENDST